MFAKSQKFPTFKSENLKSLNDPEIRGKQDLGHPYLEY